MQPALERKLAKHHHRRYKTGSCTLASKHKACMYIAAPTCAAVQTHCVLVHTDHLRQRLQAGITVQTLHQLHQQHVTLTSHINLTLGAGPRV